MTSSSALTAACVGGSRQAKWTSTSGTPFSGLTLPWGVAASGPALVDPITVALGAAVALLSSATFAVLTSLGPAIAALVGYLVLAQALAIQLVAIGLVIAASAGAVRTTTTS
jgi:inner membrane transporter RhtA